MSDVLTRPIQVLSFCANDWNMAGLEKRISQTSTCIDSTWVSSSVQVFGIDEVLVQSISLLGLSQISKLQFIREFISL